MDAGETQRLSPDELTDDDAKDLVAVASLSKDARAAELLAALRQAGFLAELVSRKVSLRGPPVMNHRVCVPRKQLDGALAFLRRRFPDVCPLPTQQDLVAQRVAGMLVHFSALKQVAYVLIGGGLALLLVGVVYLARGINEEACQRQSSYAIDYRLAHAGWTVSESGAWAGVLAVTGPACMVGAAMFAAGTLILLKRFGLRGMLLGALAAGLCGSVPFSLLPYRTGGAQVEAFVPLRASAFNYDRVVRRLEWRAAWKTLPPEMRAYLAMDRYTREADGTVTCFTSAEGVRVACTLHFPPGMNDERCATLADFYREYLGRLACEALGLPETAAEAPSPRSRWNEFRDAWRQGQAKARAEPAE